MKRIVLSLILVVMVLAVSAGTSVLSAPMQGCPNGSQDCEYLLQVCDASGCYWLTRCVGGNLVYANCAAIHDGCQFSWCGWEPIFASPDKQLPKVSPELIDAAAEIDPFAARGLLAFDGVVFKGNQSFKFLAYQFPNTRSAQKYLRQVASGNYATYLQVPMHWSEKHQMVQPNTEVVLLRTEVVNDKVILLNVTHGSTILTVKYKQTDNGYKMKLHNNS